MAAFVAAIACRVPAPRRVPDMCLALAAGSGFHYQPRAAAAARFGEWVVV